MQTVEAPYPKAVERFPRVRQSLLAAFDACALETHFEMEYRRGWSEHHQARGQLFHRFAARCFREMRAHSEERISVDVALAILDEVLSQADADSHCPECGSTKILPGVSKYMERTCGDCGAMFETEFVNVPRKHVAQLVMAAKKWAHDNEFDIEHVIDVERRLEASVHYSVHGVSIDRVLTGKPDVLLVDAQDGTHTIVIDWKDTWKLPAKSEISEEGYFQQRFYAFLVMSNYRVVERVTLREFYVRRSEVREATVWRHDLDQLEAEFAGLVMKFDRTYEEGVYVPTPGAHCGWCLRPEKCPIPRFARGSGKISSERMAKQVAAQLVVATRVKRMAEEALKAYVDVNGPVEVKDAKGKRVYGFVARPRTERPTREEIEEAILLTGGELSRQDLDRLYRSAQQTRFVDHAPDEREPADTPLLDSLAASLQRAAERRGI